MASTFLIWQAAKQVMGAELCTVYLLSDDRRTLVARMSEEEGGSFFTCDMQSGLAGYAAVTSETSSHTPAHVRSHPLTDPIPQSE